MMRGHKLTLSLAALTLTVLCTGVFGQARARAVDLLNPICQTQSVQSMIPADRPAICRDNAAMPGSPNPIFGPSGVMTKVIEILGFVIGFAAVVVIIISGLRMTISAGDSNAVAAAKSSILFAIIGLVIAALAETLVNFVLNKL